MLQRGKVSTVVSSSLVNPEKKRWSIDGCFWVGECWVAAVAERMRRASVAHFKRQALAFGRCILHVFMFMGDNKIMGDLMHVMRDVIGANAMKREVV